MARKAKAEEGASDAWLSSYADMVTLLMTFFVLLLSMSAVEEEKFDAVIASLRSAGFNTGIFIPIDDEGGIGFDFIEDFPGFPDLPGLMELPEDVLSMGTLFEVMSAYIAENEMSSAMTVTRQGEMVHIQFSSAILFEPDQYTMLPGSRPLLTFVSDVLSLYDEKIKNINIGGHTARTGRTNTGVSDWRLSSERAATVAMFLEENGVDKMKMVTIGYGDNFPIADNATEIGRSQNRRVELVIVGSDSAENFDVYGVLGGGGLQTSQADAGVTNGEESTAAQ